VCGRSWGRRCREEKVINIYPIPEPMAMCGVLVCKGTGGGRAGRVHGLMSQYLSYLPKVRACDAWC